MTFAIRNISNIKKSNIYIITKTLPSGSQDLFFTQFSGVNPNGAQVTRRIGPSLTAHKKTLTTILALYY